MRVESKMKTVEVRSLLKENIREVRLEEPIRNIFRTWYRLFVERTNREPTLIDVFYAGFVLSNPNMRDLFRIENKQENEL